MKTSQWIGLLFMIGLLLLLWQLRNILLMIFGSIVLAVAIDTLALIPQTYGFRRGGSLVITVLTLIVMAIVVGVIVVPPLFEQFTTLFRVMLDGLATAPTALNEWFERAQDWIQNINPIQLGDPDTLIQPEFEGTQDSILDPITLDLPSVRDIINSLTPQVSNLINQSVNFFTNSLTTLVSLFLLVALTILLSVNPYAYVNAFVVIFPSFYRPRIRYILRRCEVALRSWLVGILLTSLMVMGLSAVGLWLLGVPLVLANAVLAGLFNFIPNIGPTLSVVAPMATAFRVSPWHPLLVLILYVGIQQLESFVLTPIVMSRQVSLLPGLTLLAQVVFATFFGIPGLFLAVPLAAVIQVWIQETLIRDVLDPWTGQRSFPATSPVLELQPGTKIPERKLHPDPYANGNSEISSSGLNGSESNRNTPEQASESDQSTAQTEAQTDGTIS